MGRYARLAGVDGGLARRRYAFRLRHGFSDAADRAFDRLWTASDLTWADILAISARPRCRSWALIASKSPRSGGPASSGKAAVANSSVTDDVQVVPLDAQRSPISRRRESDRAVVSEATRSMLRQPGLGPAQHDVVGQHAPPARGLGAGAGVEDAGDDGQRYIMHPGGSVVALEGNLARRRRSCHDYVRRNSAHVRTMFGLCRNDNRLWMSGRSPVWQWGCRVRGGEITTLFGGTIRKS